MRVCGQANRLDGVAPAAQACECYVGSRLLKPELVGVVPPRAAVQQARSFERGLHVEPMSTRRVMKAV